MEKNSTGPVSGYTSPGFHEMLRGTTPKVGFNKPEFQFRGLVITYRIIIYKEGTWIRIFLMGPEFYLLNLLYFRIPEKAEIFEIF